jgi:hypothetical protein
MMPPSREEFEMISTQHALDALVIAGLIDSWQWTTEGEGAIKETMPDVKSAYMSVSDETYGTDSFLYFRCKNQAIAERASGALVAAGGKPNFKWNPTVPSAFDMQVEYFKGARHWE